MKTKLVVLAMVALFVCGIVVYVHASSDVSSTELSMSASPEATPLSCSKDGCGKKAEGDKDGEKKGCPKSGDSDKKKGGCDKSKKSCPKS